MIRILADENLNADIVRGLIRRLPHVDILRAQVAGLGGMDDETVLVWAASEARLVLTHDVSTLVALAWEHVKNGKRHSGVIAIAQSLPVGAVIEDLVLLAECSGDSEWENWVVYLPLR